MVDLLVESTRGGYRTSSAPPSAHTRFRVRVAAVHSTPSPTECLTSTVERGSRSSFGSRSRARLVPIEREQRFSSRGARLETVELLHPRSGHNSIFNCQQRFPSSATARSNSRRRRREGTSAGSRPTSESPINSIVSPTTRLQGARSNVIQHLVAGDPLPVDHSHGKVCPGRVPANCISSLASSCSRAALGRIGRSLPSLAPGLRLHHLGLLDEGSCLAC